MGKRKGQSGRVLDWGNNDLIVAVQSAGDALWCWSGYLHAHMKLCDTSAGFETLRKTLKHQVKTRLGGHFKAYQSSSPVGLMTVMPPDAQQIGFTGRKYNFL